MNNRKFNSDVISFYSYKGGTGRTLALIHIAYLLAQKGKNVLILDLDMESPSIQNIFKSEIEGMNYGLIDYLYNKMYEKGTEKRISISDIYVKLDGSKYNKINGNLYIVPAGKINTEYIYKLSKIQPNLISRDNYISDLIKNLESRQSLNLDFVLVDSRTGINNWSELSLIDLSDKVIFFISPNQKNIEESKLLMNITQKTKNGRIALVFSNVDANTHSKAIGLYNNIKKDLDLEQDYIEIPEDPDTITSEEFPIQKMLIKYEKIISKCI